MSKSRDAFRTISEVSDVLDTPAHVLRFWESKFTQVKPVKRAGGRRYYRPADVDLLAGIKQLLHDDGMTIKGAQKLLREQGVKHVIGIGAAQLAATAPETKAADPAPIEAAPEPQDPTPEVTEPTMAPPEPVAAVTLDITNVVPLPAATAQGPMLSLNIDPKEAPKVEAIPEAEVQPEAKTRPVVPADPSDADSKVPPRFFNHLHKASHDKLAKRAAQITPLLNRMQVLRDRIATR